MIDFHDETNARMYSDRVIDPRWSEFMRSLTNPEGCAVVDLGCGGGMYSRQWLEMGAHMVTGVDSSAPIIEAAKSDHAAYIREGTAQFIHSDASNTSLPDHSADIVFSRALIHHVPDMARFFNECLRLLRPGGTLVIQDRTMEDIEQPASEGHIRGFFFTVFPRLLDIETRRRPAPNRIEELVTSIFESSVRRDALWENREVHSGKRDLLEDMSRRRGRSILHELDDAELSHLVTTIDAALPAGPVTDADRWSVWSLQRH